jgi:phosphoribosylanthranilate isomerase
MNSLKIKICGMREPQNIREVGALVPDYMGFIFYPGSPRYVGAAPNLPEVEGVKRVGVFVGEEPSVVVALAGRYHLQVVQLHGQEPPQEVELLKDCGLEVWKVFGVEDAFDFSQTEGYRAADYFLFDTHSPAYGGAGKPFNWSKLNEYSQEKPFFLSGGLDESLLEEAQRQSHWNLAGLDFNSRLELAPGLKDVKKVERIVKSFKRV